MSILAIVLIVLVILALGGAFYGRGAGWYGDYSAPPGSGASGAPPTANPQSYQSQSGWWGPRRYNYGYYHSGLLGLVLLIVLILVLVGVLV